MDNPEIVHQTRLESHGTTVQSYVRTGRIRLDLNGITAPLNLDIEDAERLIGILRAAVADKEA